MLVMLIMLFSALNLGVIAVSNREPAAFSDSSGVYLVRTSGYHADVICHGQYNLNISLDVNEPIDAVTAGFGKVLFFSNDTRNNQIVVSVYDIQSDYLDSFSIYGCSLFSDTAVCCDRDRLYIKSHQNSREVKIFSLEGIPVKNLILPGDITDMAAGYQNGIYAVVGDELYKLSGGNYKYISGSSVLPPLSAAGENVLVSKVGEAYVLNGDYIDRVLNVNTNMSSCMIEDTLYISDGDSIYGYDLKSGKTVSYYITKSGCQALCTVNGRILCLDGDSTVSLERSDFIDLVTPRRDNSNNGAYSDNHNTDISSDSYSIDNLNYTISNIPNGTSVAAFRSNIQYDGYSLSIYREDSEKSSGNIGTAMYAVFSKGTTRIEYELSVRGDLTGEGSVNSRDLNFLMDSLIGSADYNGVYTLSADLSGNKVVDIADVVLLKKLIS